MNKAKKLLHTRYRVNDLERTVKFYKEVLGLEEIRRNKSPRGSELVFLKVSGSDEQIEITYAVPPVLLVIEIDPEPCARLAIQDIKGSRLWITLNCYEQQDC